MIRVLIRLRGIPRDAEDTPKSRTVRATSPMMRYGIPKQNQRKDSKDGLVCYDFLPGTPWTWSFVLCQCRFALSITGILAARWEFVSVRGEGRVFTQLARTF